MTRPLSVDLPINVRTYDIDSAGHVSNIVYIRWLEDLRLELFEKHFSLQAFVQENITLVLATTHIDYKRSIRLFDRVTAQMWVESLTNATIKLRAEFAVDGKKTTEAWHSAVFVDLRTMKPRRVPEIVRTRFNESQPLP
ncbi:MAG: thioesterase family protein [Candidatus Obscuribacterales bacterium]|nr:thioesterase family protein [Candidatus Obscuribacterales bacterium]